MISTVMALASLALSALFFWWWFITTKRFDILVYNVYSTKREQWRALGEPVGFFWTPEESVKFFRSMNARNRLFMVFLFRPKRLLTDSLTSGTVVDLRMQVSNVQEESLSLSTCFDRGIMKALILISIVGGLTWFMANGYFNWTPKDPYDNVAARWQKAPLKEIDWRVEKVFSKIPGMRWLVKYKYSVGGVVYEGKNISPRRTSLRVGYDTMPIDTLGWLNDLEMVWYDPANPSNSALFTCPDRDIMKALKDSYEEITTKAKKEGRWP